MPFKDTTLITRTWDYHVWCYFMLRYIRLKLMNSELTPLLLLLLSQLIIHSPSFQKLKYIYFLCTSKSFKHWFTKWTWSILMNKIIAQRFVWFFFLRLDIHHAAAELWPKHIQWETGIWNIAPQNSDGKVPPGKPLGAKRSSNFLCGAALQCPILTHTF